jgi:hypothetical protein
MSGMEIVGIILMAPFALLIAGLAVCALIMAIGAMISGITEAISEGRAMDLFAHVAMALVVPGVFIWGMGLDMRRAREKTTQQDIAPITTGVESAE